MFGGALLFLPRGMLPSAFSEPADSYQKHCEAFSGEGCYAGTMSYKLDAVEAGNWNSKCSVASQLDSCILEYSLSCCESATLQKRQGFLRENRMSKCPLEKVVNSVGM